MIALIHYKAGNTASVSNALNELRADFMITSNPDEIARAEKIIFPGVGEASAAMQDIINLGLTEALTTTEKPLLGICVGLQLLNAHSSEGDIDCLGVFPHKVIRFSSERVKVPHMGWNRVRKTNESRLFDGIEQGEYFYFANSYYVPENEFTTAVTTHGVLFSAAMHYENFYGVQFHPEKSGKAGLHVLKNFIDLC